MLQRMHAQCLWTSNRNPVEDDRRTETSVCKSSISIESIEAGHGGVGKNAARGRRWAMGITGHKVASEFITGETGWFTSEARETLTKLRYFAHIGAMDEHRWPRMVLPMMASGNIYTEAIKRLKD